MYGVVIGKVIEAHDERTGRSPHYQLRVDAGTSGKYEIPINVRSKDTNRPDLLYYAEEDFNAQAITILTQMRPGFHKINYHENEVADIAIDFIRSGLFNPKEMKIVSSNQTGPDNDLSDFINTYMKKAEGNPNAIIYAYGTHYTDSGKGIHNVHMNQGNTRFNPEENDVFHDGCVLVHFRDENKWLAYFLAFQSQSWCTDEQGDPLHDSVDSEGYPKKGCTYDTIHVNLQTSN
ncbi:YukJ family protein [Peribacillus butanolivorans]|uniref:YukJ family protein n=1 Tax=Peribacillus butanolivorans TaxID=421767 RepID=UPI003808E443